MGEKRGRIERREGDPTFEMERDKVFIGEREKRNFFFFERDR